jgi:predicted dehydrogenase
MSVAPFRGALIGCGFVSQYHLAAWREVSGASLVALCDLDAGRLARASEQVPDARIYREATDLFAAGGLDFVEICTRPESHVALVALAARHGVHVLCQKPAATTAEDLQAMVDACDKAGVRLMIHENWRFRPWYRALRAEIDAGTIGRPIRLRLVHRDTRALRPDGFRDQPYFQQMPRLILLEMGCHLVDTARYLLGEVATVSATLGHFGEGHPGEDLATLSLEFSSGALGLLDLTWCAPPELARPEWALNESVVEGAEGTLRLRLDGTLERVGLNGAIEHRPVRLPPDDQVYLGGYTAVQNHFIEGLQRGIEHETSGHDTLRTMEVVWSAYRSAEEGRRVILSAS